MIYQLYSNKMGGTKVHLNPMLCQLHSNKECKKLGLNPMFYQLYSNKVGSKLTLTLQCIDNFAPLKMGNKFHLTPMHCQQLYSNKKMGNKFN